MSDLYVPLGIALGLGLLVGLQRESVASRLAGLRTFSLITLLGALSGLLAQRYGGWIVAAGLVSLAGLIVIAKVIDARGDKPDPGLTTEIAILLMYGVGAFVILGPPAIAIAIGGVTAVLLHFKGELHNAVARLTAADLKVIMQFALLSLVILPVLPNQTYGPYEVINPRNIWWMVVLIVGIGLTGYISYQFFGEKAGLVLTGLLGGLISSTATTVSFARRSKRSTHSSQTGAIVILLANTVVFVRVMIEIAAVEPEMLREAAPPLLLMMCVGVAGAGLWWAYGRGSGHSLPEQSNPSELSSALFFAGLYAAILFLVALTKDQFGNRGLFLVAGISGLTDVDAITLSTAQLVRLERLPSGEAWRVVVMAILSNLVFKLGTVLFLGDRILKLRVGFVFLATIGTGVMLLLWWPH
jgi:uncharacterized membrane protein (DUF4010 family)